MKYVVWQLREGGASFVPPPKRRQLFQQGCKVWNLGERREQFQPGQKEEHFVVSIRNNIATTKYTAHLL